MDIDHKKPISNPFERANPISKLFFLWLLPIFRKGFCNELSINDLYDAPESQKSGFVVGKLKSLEQTICPYCHTQSVEGTFLSTQMGTKYFICMHCGGRIGYQPIYLGKLIQSFSDGDRSAQAINAGIVCLCSLLHGLIIHQSVYIMYRLGLACRTGLSAMLYQKSLVLSIEDRPVGRLLNLLSNDVARLDVQLVFISYAVVGPLQLIIIVYIMYDELGAPAFAMAGFVILILPTRVLNGNLASKFRLQVATQTDERCKLMTEIVAAIRVIKMYAWEKPFSELIQKIRKKEAVALKRRAYLKGFFLSLYSFSTRFSAFIVVVPYVLMGNQLTPDKAFFIVATSMTITETLIFFFSSAFIGLGESIASMGRIEKFLLLPEKPPTTINMKEKSTIISKITLHNTTATWDNAEKPTLNNMELELVGPKTVMVVGPVGAGKSSLLQLLISELPLTEGDYALHGEISYASQEPWIFPASIKQNICFGDNFDSFRYEKVVAACALHDDFVQLPRGDATVVGERGITLSGGQKARINLARALYKEADVYLLDDPLSAVDSRVSRHIFENCVQKLLKDKLCILVTHQVQYLPLADHVVLIQNGRVAAQGPYETMSSIDLVSFMSKAESGVTAQQRRKSSAVQASLGSEAPLLSNDAEDNDVGELNTKGTVSLKNYWEYLIAAKSPLLLISVIILFLLAQLLFTGSEYWLAFWSDSEEKHHHDQGVEKAIVLSTDHYLGMDNYIWIYSALVALLFVVSTIKTFGLFRYCLNIGIELHKAMFNAVVRSPTKFFDNNTTGQIMNRFTKDLGSVDELLPHTLFDTVEYLLQMIGVVVVLLISNYLLIIPTILVTLMFGGLRMVFMRSSRDVKRLEATWKSPVFTHVTSSMEGLATIRALKAEETLTNQFYEKQDIHSSAWFMYISVSRWFAIIAESTGILFLTLIIYTLILFSGDTSGGILGLVVTSVMNLAVNVQWAIRQSAELENNMISAERTLQYSKLQPEAPLDVTDKRPPSEWPNNGEVQFQNVFLRYSETDVLVNLNFTVNAREKIGIVGRTGAGKSSIISAIFRLTEPRGDIFIDGVAIKEIGLHELRKQISIIPQDPVLFSGTIRSNLDPFSEYNDALLWSVLEEVQLKDAITALDFKVSDYGSNFSVGQRQLICMARAILRRNKIILMDEATANVDPKTDAFIQSTIREKFAACTVITIAHRLHSVMNCDKILVLDGGRVREYDSPHVLIQREEGWLQRMAKHTGEGSFQKLKALAKMHFDETNQE